MDEPRTVPRPERMSGVDRAWLEMDEARNPMVVSAILELEDVASIAHLARTMAQRLLRYPRFRERPDDSHSPPRWLPDEDFDLGYHVRVRRLPRRQRGSDEAALRDAIGAELTEDLDRARPLWRWLLFPRGHGRVTALFRAHHALADGIALVQVLMSCTDAAMRLRKGAQAATAASAHIAHAGPLGGVLDKLEAFNAVLDGLKTAALEDLRHPRKLAEQWRAGSEALGAVGRVLSLPQNNPPALRQPLSGRRAVAWIDDLPFAPLHELARALGVKLNDLFMAALAGAVGDVLRAQGIGMTEAQNLRVSIPVNLRNGNDGELGNCFGLVLLDLPIAIQDPLHCLEIVSARMQALKKSPEAKAVLASLAAAGHLPVPWEKRLVGWVGGKAAAVVSNLPGPRRSVKLAGARVRSLVFWPPQTGGIGLGVSLFSYAARVSIGVSADAKILPKPQVLVDAFIAELGELRRLARPRGRIREVRAWP